jgi:galactoside O-acetyltransferase
MEPIISANIRVRHPEHFHVQDDSIVDDYCYFSTRVYIGRCSHVASGCSVAGGVEREFRLGDFCSLSSGVKIWCTSDDFVNDVVTIIPAGMRDPKKNLISGDVVLDN